MAKIKPKITFDRETSKLIIEINVAGITEEALLAYGLKPIKGRGRRAAGAKPAGGKTGARRRRRTAEEVKAEKAQKELAQKARKALKLPLKGRLKPDDQEKLNKKVAELQAK